MGIGENRLRINKSKRSFEGFLRAYSGTVETFDGFSTKIV